MKGILASIMTSSVEQEGGARWSADVIRAQTFRESAKTLVENQFNFKRLVLVLCSFKIY